MPWTVLAMWVAASSPALAVGTVEVSDPEAGVQVVPAPLPCDGETRVDTDGNVVACDPVSTEFLALDTPNVPTAPKDLEKALKKAARKARRAAKQRARSSDQPNDEVASGL